ncbi:MAG: DUF6159 family protein [archaeon]|nr:DUF6159 family protein [archaeon]
MFESIKAGWKLTKVSFAMLMEEKKLMIFPFLSAFFSILLLVGFFAPFVITGALSVNTDTESFGNVLYLAVLFAYYIGTSFLAIFFNVALVHAVKSRIEGSGESMSSSISFAFSRFGVILQWAVLSALVGLIMNAIESAARKVKGIGPLLLGILRGIIGLAWGLLTFFIIPVIVYQNLGVIDTIKKSGETLKATWKEALFIGFSTGLIFFAMFLIWVIIGAVAIISAIAIEPLIGVAVALFFVFGFLIMILIQSAISQIYKTLLYLYADQGILPPGFSEAEVQNLFRK